MFQVLDNIMQEEQSRKAFGKRLNNVRLLERFRALSNCEPEKQETVIRLIDAVIVKHRVEAALTPVS